jgi:hypothetical protein
MNLPVPSQCCPICDLAGAKRVKRYEVNAGPFVTNASMREIVHIFNCQCGTLFAQSESKPLISSTMSF